MLVDVGSIYHYDDDDGGYSEVIVMMRVMIR